MSQKSQVEDQREFGRLTLCYNMQNTESENKNYKVGFGELFQLEIDFEIYLSIPALQLCWPGLGRAQHVLKPCRHTRRSQVHRVALWLLWGFQNKNTGFPGTIPNFANEKEPKRNFCGQVQTRVPLLVFTPFSPFELYICSSWLLLFCLNIVLLWTGWSEDDFVCLTCIPSS